MKVIDLTHTITERMPVYPGTLPPKLTPANTYEKDHFRETLLTLYSHTGTHMDAPAHLLMRTATLDILPAERFVGSALVIDCAGRKEGTAITLQDIRRAGPAAEKAEFLLFRTGWDAHWQTDRYFGDYPCIDMETADYLAVSGKKGVGVDTIGLDPVGNQLPRHRRVLGAGMVIIENLTGLQQIGASLFTLAALPLRFEDSDGAPIRAVALLPDA